MIADSPPPRRARFVVSIVYRLDQAASSADLILRLSPRALPGQRVSYHQVIIDPRPARAEPSVDEHGNAVTRIAVASAFTSLTIRAVSTASRPAPGPEDPAARAALARYGLWPGDPPYPDLPRHGREACRAHAEAILGRARSLGLACRYMAGIPWPRRRGPSLLHAWAAVEVPGQGWLEIDGTTGAIDPGHLVLASGAGYEDAAPVSGTLGAEGRCRLVCEVSAEPLD